MSCEMECLSESFSIFQTRWPGLKKEQVEVFLSDEFDHETTEQLESIIEQVWKEKTAKNERLYSKSKFRLGSILDSQKRNIDIYRPQRVSEHNKITLGIGTSDYRQHVGTNLNPESVDYIKKCGTRAMFADIIGVNGVLITSDDYVVIVKRASWVGEHAGLLDTPGGHAEPSKVDATSPSQVRNELFDSFKDELHCEFNISKSDLSEPMLYAIARLGTLAGRVNFYYRITTTLTKENIECSWKKGGNETDEATELTFVPLSSVPEIESSEIWGLLSPHGRLALQTVITALKER